jgi:hypothetical protein
MMAENCEVIRLRLDLFVLFCSDGNEKFFSPGWDIKFNPHNRKSLIGCLRKYQKGLWHFNSAMSHHYAAIFFHTFYSRIYGTILPLIHPHPIQMLYDLLSLRDMLPLWSVLTKCHFRKFSKSDKRKIFSFGTKI